MDEKSCLPATGWPIPWWDLTGISLLTRTIAAHRANRVVEMVQRGLDDASEREGRNVTTMSFRIFHYSGLTTSDPENIKAVLATQFSDFEVGVIRRKGIEPLAGRGIFTADGSEWEHFRSMLRPAFARNQIGNLEVQERHCQEILRQLPTDETTHWTEPVDLQPLFYEFTLNGALEFLLGIDVTNNTAEDEDSDVSPRALAQAFDNAQNQLLEASLKSWWKPWWDSETKEAIGRMHNLVDHYVQRALSNHASEETVEGDDKFILVNEVSKETQDPMTLRSHILHMLLAGRETTAALLSWLFVFLARHPGEFSALRIAIIQHFGGNGEVKLTFERLKQCHYLQYCLNEALRLRPPLPMNSRTAVKDTTLPRGGGPGGLSPLHVPKGTIVEYWPSLMHTRKDIWGEDAQEFRPERWAGRKFGWDFLPFNGGPRICIGQQYALTSAAYVVVKLLQQFDEIENCNPDADPAQRITITNVPANGVQLKLHKWKYAN